MDSNPGHQGNPRNCINSSGRLEETAISIRQSINQSINLHSCLRDSAGESTDNDWEISTKHYLFKSVQL